MGMGAGCSSQTVKNFKPGEARHNTIFRSRLGPNSCKSWWQSWWRPLLMAAGVLQAAKRAFVKVLLGLALHYAGRKRRGCSEAGPRQGQASGKECTEGRRLQSALEGRPLDLQRRTGLEPRGPLCAARGGRLWVFYSAKIRIGGFIVLTIIAAPTQFFSA